MTDVVRAGAPANVLLVEDDFEFRRLLVRVLSKDGHRVTEIGSGAELVHWLGRALTDSGEIAGLDLIVSDVRMPGWSGLEAVEALRRIGCRVPVILMTAFSDEQIGDVARVLGVTALFSKPLDCEQLRAAVSATIARAGRRAT